MTLLPRCAHLFGYCAKTKPPKGEMTHRMDKYDDYRTLPDCKDDYRTCGHYRILTVDDMSPQAGASERTS